MPMIGEIVGLEDQHPVASGHDGRHDLLRIRGVEVEVTAPFFTPIGIQIQNEIEAAMHLHDIVPVAIDMYVEMTATSYEVEAATGIVGICNQMRDVRKAAQFTQEN